MAKPELRDHRKFTRLRRLLGEPTPHVIGYLECMWMRGYQTGNPVLGDGLDVEAAAEFPGVPGTFLAATIEAGFIDENEDGTYSIHNLYSHAPEYVQKRMIRRGFAPDGAMPSVTDPGRPPRGGRRRKTEENGVNSAPSGGKRRTEPRTKNQEPRDEKHSAEIGSAKPDPEVSEQPSPTVIVVPKPDPGPAKPPRPRRLLFDAIAEVSGTDPTTAGGMIGKVESKLAAADPPYTPDDVREFGRRFWELCGWAERDGRARPTPGEIEKWIGGIRAQPPPVQPTRPPPSSKRGKDLEFLASQAADAFPNGVPPRVHDPPRSIEGPPRAHGGG